MGDLSALAPNGVTILLTKTMGIDVHGGETPASNSSYVPVRRHERASRSSPTQTPADTPQGQIPASVRAIPIIVREGNPLLYGRDKSIIQTRREAEQTVAS